MISETQTVGWRDLIVQTGGGSYPTQTVVLRFNGQAYPPNPTTDAPPAGENPNGVIVWADHSEPRAAFDLFDLPDLIYRTPKPLVCKQPPIAGNSRSIAYSRNLPGRIKGGRSMLWPVATVWPARDSVEFAWRAVSNRLPHRERSPTLALGLLDRP